MTFATIAAVAMVVAVIRKEHAECDSKQECNDHHGPGSKSGDPQSIVEDYGNDCERNEDAAEVQIHNAVDYGNYHYYGDDQSPGSYACKGYRKIKYIEFPKNEAYAVSTMTFH